MSDSVEADCETRMAIAADFWKANGSRITFVRRILCKIIFNTTQPFAADWVLDQAHRIDKQVSITSVYRTLKSLREANLVEEHFSKIDKGLYELMPLGQGASACIICKNCGKTIPIDDPCLLIREGAQIHRHGFKATHMRLQTEATCDDFQLTGSCDKC
jgi:Fe2+ or Zn2+ uptake regulation protein